MKYIKEKTFGEFCKQQGELVSTLNHRMTKVEEHLGVMKTDVIWLKKLLWGILGTVMTILLTILIKTAFGL